MHPIADQILIERYRAGDRDALERLIRRWNTEVLSLAYRLTGDREEALDIRQQTFLKMYSALPAFRAQARFSTWLYRIVVNLCRDHLRSADSRSKLIANTRGAALDAIHASPSQFEIHERREVSRLVIRAIMSLPAVEREVVVLRHYQQMPFTEIAVVVGTPVTTVKSRMMRGLKHLRQQLESLNDARERETSQANMEGG